jgi:DNA-directed RNA polymerase subunit E"
VIKLVVKACRKCKLISEKNVCPDCKSTDLSDDFGGFVIIRDQEKSFISKAMGVKKPGQYAIRVR